MKKTLSMLGLMGLSISLSTAQASGLADVYFQDKEHVRINPYTRVTSSVFSSNLLMPVAYDASIANNIKTLTFEDKESGAYLESTMGKEVLSHPLKALGKKLALPTFKKCDLETCKLFLSYPSGYMMLPHQDTLQLSLKGYDDVGIKMMEEEFAIDNKVLPSGFTLFENILVEYDQESNQVKGRLPKTGSFDTITLSVETQYDGETERHVYYLDKGMDFSMDIPQDTEKLTLNAQALFSKDHQYHAKIILWDDHDPFFVKPHKRWTQILTKGLWHNDMAVHHEQR